MKKQIEIETENKEKLLKYWKNKVTQFNLQALELNQQKAENVRQNTDKLAELQNKLEDTKTDVKEKEKGMLMLKKEYSEILEENVENYEELMAMEKQKFAELKEKNEFISNQVFFV